MASLLLSPGLLLSLITLILFVASCDGRPQPPDFTSYFTSKTSIRVEWTEPTLDPGAKIRGFRLHYQLGDDGKLVKLKLGSSTPFSHDIEGLTEQCGNYRIRMLTVSTKGTSRPTSFSQIERLRSAPENLNAAPSAPSAPSVRVTWSPPPNSFCISGYRLQYGPNENSLEVIELPAELSQYLLTDVQPDTTYLLTLAAYTADSVGDEALVQWYQVGPPSPPANLRANPASAETAVVMWSPTSAGVTRYEYLYGPAEAPDSKLTTGYVGPSTTLIELEGLTPREEYVIKVKSVNNAEQSEAVSVTWTQPAPPTVEPPSKPVPQAPGQVTVGITSAETAHVAWTAPEGDAEINGYIVGFGLQGSTDNELTLFSVPPDELQTELDGLKPGLRYIVNVEAYNDVSNGPITSAEWLQEAPEVPLEPPSKPVPQAPGQVTVEITSAETALVTWTAPEGDTEIVGYIVGFGLQGSTGSELTLFSLPPDELETELDGLKPGSRYVVNVQAYDAVNDGPIASAEWSQEAPEVPLSIPTEPRGVLVYSTSPTTIAVRWLLQDDVAAEQTEGFRVTYGPDMAASEFTLSVTPDQDSVEIQNLQPDSFYYIKLYKFNAAGQSSPVTRSLQTLTPPPGEGCVQQQQCIQQFESQLNIQGTGGVCQSIQHYLNCLRRLQVPCMHDAGYRSQVASVQNLFRAKSCNRGPGGLPNLEETVPEVIPPPTDLQVELLTPSSARLSWVDATLGESQVPTDGRFYNIRYRSQLDEEYLEVRTQETSYVADSLRPGVQYEFSVQLVLGPKRKSNLTSPVFIVPRDPQHGLIPQRFTVTQLTVSTPTTVKAMVNWLPPPERPSVMEYRIEYTASEEFRDPATIWDRMTVYGPEMSTVIDGLASDQVYHARITAVFSPTESGPTLAVPIAFTTPVIPASSKTSKQCGETEMEAVTRRANFLWEGVADGTQRPPLYGIPIPYCEDEYGVEECHGLFCFCIPGSKPPALRMPQCSTDTPPCRREYDAARTALAEARQKGIPAMAAQLPHCRDDGNYHPKQCSGTMCYCVTEDGTHTGQERPLWEASSLYCE